MRRQLQSVHDAHHTRNIDSRTMSAIQLAGMLSLCPNTKDEHLGVKRGGHSRTPSNPLQQHTPSSVYKWRNMHAITAQPQVYLCWPDANIPPQLKLTLVLNTIETFASSHRDESTVPEKNQVSHGYTFVIEAPAAATCSRDNDSRQLQFNVARATRRSTSQHLHCSNNVI